MHVDHVVPLKGISYEDKAPICGLNVWYNLMPLPYDINIGKKNLCYPVYQNKLYPFKHFSLSTLPKPKDWMKFIKDQERMILEDISIENYRESIKATRELTNKLWSLNKKRN